MNSFDVKTPAEPNVATALDLVDPFLMYMRVETGPNLQQQLDRIEAKLNSLLEAQGIATGQPPTLMMAHDGP